MTGKGAGTAPMNTSFDVASALIHYQCRMLNIFLRKINLSRLKL